MGAGLGVGIASFVEGLKSGANLGREFNNDAENAKYKRGILDHYAAQAALEKQKADRDDKTAALNNEKIQLELDESNKNAPLRDMQRTTLMDTAKNAALNAANKNKVEELRRTTLEQGTQDYNNLKAKSIKEAKDQYGNTVYSVDGKNVDSKEAADKLFEENHGILMNALGPRMAEAAKQAALITGDPKDAENFTNFFKQEGVKKGQESAGRAIQAFHNGDLDGVGKYATEAINSDYLHTHGHDGLKAEVVKDKDGKPAALRLSGKDMATGQKYEQILDDENKIGQFLEGLYNPVSVFTHNKARGEAATANEAEIAKEAGKKKLGIGVKQAEASDPTLVRKDIINRLISKGVPKVKDRFGNERAMTVDEINNIADGIMKSQGVSGALGGQNPQAQPTQVPLYNR